MRSAWIRSRSQTLPHEAVLLRKEAAGLAAVVERWITNSRRSLVDMKAGPAIGSQVGNYHLSGLVGRGGMGVVYSAVHTITGERVALKLMAPNLAEDEDFRRRFLLEADASSLLEHPNIVRVFEAGISKGELFLVMELIDGRDLKKVLAQEALAAVRLAKLLSQAGDALDAAHEQGIVHRDIKPQNLLVSSDDRVYVADFGLIKRASTKSSLTLRGQILGSVHYLAPEQIDGAAIDGRVDVYSLGCVAFECLTGRVPFDRELELAVLVAHTRDERPKPSLHNPLVPSEVDAIVAKAMAIDPDERYLTCGDFVRDLSEHLNASAEPITPHAEPSTLRTRFRRLRRRATISYDPHPSQRRLWARDLFPQQARVRTPSSSRSLQNVVLAVALSVALGMAVTSALPLKRTTTRMTSDGSVERKNSTHRGTADEVREVERDKQRRADPRRTLEPRRTRSSRSQLPIAATLAEITELHEPLLSHMPGRAPGVNGKIAFDDGRDIWVTGTHGRGLMNATGSVADGVGASWSPDGSGLLFSTVSWGRIMLMDAKGTTSYKISDGRDGEWSPDGTQVVLTYYRSDIAVIGVNGRRFRLLTDDVEHDRDPTWSPDGSKVAFVHVRCRYVNRSVSCPENEELRGGDIHVVDVTGGAPQPLTFGLRDSHPDWSPDGSRIVFERREADGRSHVYVMDADGSNQRRISPVHLGGGAPTWSPDGRLIAFHSSDGRGNSAIYVMAATGGNVVRLKTGGDAYRPAWQPRCSVRGTSGDDVLTGTDGPDLICGYGGNDVVRPGSGNDVVFGGPGRDRIEGVSGNDILVGSDGGDRIFGGDGDDRLVGGGGRDHLDGGNGTDHCSASKGSEKTRCE